MAERLAAREKGQLPTFVLLGAEDGAALPNASAGKEGFFARACRREGLPGVGHFPHWERPQAMSEACLQADRDAIG